MTRLSELEPEWATANGSAFSFLCPCGRGERIIVPLANPRDGGQCDPPERWGKGMLARWTADGYDFHTMSLAPSLNVPGDSGEAAPHLHVIVRGGELVPA